MDVVIHYDMGDESIEVTYSVDAEGYNPSIAADIGSRAAATVQETYVRLLAAAKASQEQTVSEPVQEP